MTCDERKEPILLYACESLDFDEKDEIAAHLLSGCPRCVGQLAEATAVLAHIPRLLDPIVPSPAVKERLMTAVARTRRSGSRETGGTTTPAARWLWPVVAAGLAAGLTAIALLPSALRQRRALESELATRTEHLRELEASVASAREMIRTLRSPAVEVVALHAPGPQPKAAARIFWDRARGVWHFTVTNLEPPPPGKTYELWFITVDERKVPAGTFEVNASGEGSLEVEVPSDIGPIAVAAVTDEPAGGVPQPTGSIQLVGKLGV